MIIDLRDECKKLYRKKRQRERRERDKNTERERMKARQSEKERGMRDKECKVEGVVRNNPQELYFWDRARAKEQCRSGKQNRRTDKGHGVGSIRSI